MTERRIVYALERPDGSVFYVGTTGRPEARLRNHRHNHGEDFNFMTLQSEFENEHYADAEAKWIAHYKSLGHRLMNKLFPDPERKRSPLDDPESEASQLAYCQEMLRLFPKVSEIAKANDLAPATVARLAVSQFQMQPGVDVETETFNVGASSGALSYEEARELYKRLSRFFSQQGIKNIDRSALKERGRLGAQKRWKKSDDSNA